MMRLRAFNRSRSYVITEERRTSFRIRDGIRRFLFRHVFTGEIDFTYIYIFPFAFRCTQLTETTSFDNPPLHVILRILPVSAAHRAAYPELAKGHKKAFAAARQMPA